MKKSTLILLIIFAVLGSGTAWYLSQDKADGKRTYDVSDMHFEVPKEQIHKIFLADRKGNNSTLVRQSDDKWTFNGEHIARKEPMLGLLNTLERLTVKYRPPRPAINRIVEQLATVGIKVEVYGKEDELLKSYYVGGTDEAGTGTYMIMEGADEPFVMHMRNFIGSLRPKYFLIGDEWRDRHVFHQDPAAVKSISLEYPKQKNKSFRLEKTDDGYTVAPFFNTTSKTDLPYRKGSAEQYLNFFPKLQVEAYQNRYPLRDTVSTLLPFAVLTYTLEDNTSRSLRFIPFHKIDRYGNTIPPDYNQGIFRFHVDASWGDFMVVQQAPIKKIFQEYDFFFGKDG